MNPLVNWKKINKITKKIKKFSNKRILLGIILSLIVLSITVPAVYLLSQNFIIYIEDKDIINPNINPDNKIDRNIDDGDLNKPKPKPKDLDDIDDVDDVDQIKDIDDGKPLGDLSEWLLLDFKNFRFTINKISKKMRFSYLIEEINFLLSRILVKYEKYFVNKYGKNLGPLDKLVLSLKNEKIEYKLGDGIYRQLESKFIREDTRKKAFIPLRIPELQICHRKLSDEVNKYYDCQDLTNKELNLEIKLRIINSHIFYSNFFQMFGLQSYENNDNSEQKIRSIVGGFIPIEIILHKEGIIASDIYNFINEKLHELFAQNYDELGENIYIKPLLVKVNAKEEVKDVLSLQGNQLMPGHILIDNTKFLIIFVHKNYNMERDSLSDTDFTIKPFALKNNMNEVIQHEVFSSFQKQPLLVKTYADYLSLSFSWKLNNFHNYESDVRQNIFKYIENAKHFFGRRLVDHPVYPILLNSSNLEENLFTLLRCQKISYENNVLDEYIWEFSEFNGNVFKIKVSILNI